MALVEVERCFDDVARQEMEQLRHQLVGLASAHKQFIGNASHQLRTPLFSNGLSALVAIGRFAAATSGERRALASS
jgi:signal transduction histidine kinase